MRDHLADTYGEAVAERYDAWFPAADPAMLARLERLAGGGRVLELGIGTGRVALPLQHRGLEVHGIESSEAMLACLRRKPGGERLPVTVGDFAAFELSARYDLVAVVFNTFFALPSQEAQVGCFRCVARHLTPAGRFLVDAFVPDPGRFEDGQCVRAVAVERDRTLVEYSVHDAAAQTVDTQLVEATATHTSLYPLHIRYAWPSELDLMARLAGLELRARWSGWSEQPFTSDSKQHVSVYGPATRRASA